MKNLIIEQPPISITKLKAYTDYGFCVIPLNGKIPQNAKWQEATYKDLSSVDDSTTLPHNFGWKLEKGYLVVDIDPKNFAVIKEKGKLPLKEDSVQKLKKELGVDLMACKVKVKTGSGGWHCYYKKPPHIKVINELKDRFPGIEFKSSGRQVVGAGSYHPDTGKEYYFTKDSSNLADIEYVPDELLEIITNKSLSDEQGTGYYTDSTQDIERAKEMLSKVPPAVEKDNGDNATYRACCIGRDFGLSPEVFLNLLLDWNDLCSPPWEPEELEQKMLNAYKYGVNQIGVKTPEADFSSDVINLSKVIYSKEEIEEQTENLIPWESQIEYRTVRTGDGEDQPLFPKCTFNNTAIYLANHDAFKNKIALNEFANRVVWLQPASWHIDKTAWPEDGLPYCDDDALRIKEFFNTKCQYDPPLSMVHEASRLVSLNNRFHPVRQSILNCQWDGEQRIDTWLIKYLGAQDTPYVRAISRKIIVGIVSRVFNPGCKFDYVPILEGEQGIGKSTALQILGGRWYTDTFIDMRSKDAPLFKTGSFKEGR